MCVVLTTPYALRCVLCACSFDPRESSMKALFLAHSPMLRANSSLPSLDNIHVYELLCHLLNIQPQPNNGSLSTWSPYMTHSR